MSAESNKLLSNGQHESLSCASNSGPANSGLIANEDDKHIIATTSSLQDNMVSAKPQPSKTQLKKMQKKVEWEAGRDDRKLKRRAKAQAKRERNRAAQQEKLGDQAHVAQNQIVSGEAGGPRKLQKSKQLPITFLFDCQFDDLMLDGELISLASQLTRCYSDNRKAPFRAHLVVSSYNGKLKERYEGVLNGQHESWKGIRFLPEDFVTVAEQAKAWMKEPDGGIIAGALQDPFPTSDVGVEDVAASEGEVVYLSSDSPNTLTELRPFSTYIIGGLVDRNRHKGICYKRALERNVRTAKLPIGQFIEMQTRTVLATNHVNEIMLKWLEFGEWGKAFFDVIPKRKGGKLKDTDDDDDVVEQKTITKVDVSETDHINKCQSEVIENQLNNGYSYPDARVARTDGDTTSNSIILQDTTPTIISLNEPPASTHGGELKRKLGETADERWCDEEQGKKRKDKLAP